MPQNIDVTGLSPEAVRAVESVVGLLREKAANRNGGQPTIFDLFGKAPKLRTAADIARQVREEHDSWGEP
jgi:hypothetical protein